MPSWKRDPEAWKRAIEATADEIVAAQLAAEDRLVAKIATKVVAKLREQDEKLAAMRAEALEIDAMGNDEQFLGAHTLAGMVLEYTS